MITGTLIALLAVTEPEWLLTAAARTKPAGAIAGAEVLFPLSEDRSWAAGPYASYAFYWAELGAKLQARAAGGLLTGSLWLGGEPGFFIPAEAQSDDRRGGARALARARVELNLRSDRFWLYCRSTAEARARSFAERDPYRDAVFDRELSGEQALAVMFSPLRFGPDGALWVYVEGTIGGAVEQGLLDLRPSSGLVLEAPWSGWTFNADLYWSLREGALNGLGALFFVWWRP